jgi:hypothetical protein
MIEIVIDRVRLEGRINLAEQSAEKILAERPPHPGLAPDERLPDATRLWAALQQVSGGSWGGAVYDVEAILRALGVNPAS